MDSRWKPNVTVAAVIPHEDRYLMVEERDRDTGAIVYNQPAGHLESGESLVEAVCREVLEETRWEVRVTGYLGVARFIAPNNGICYLRHSFLCLPLREIGELPLDDGIIAARWMSVEDLQECHDKLRSPLVMKVIEQHRAGLAAPMELVTDCP